jgi:hypothetical protein
MEDNTNRFSQNLFLCAIFAALSAFAGCGRNHPPPLAQTAGGSGAATTGMPPLTEQKLDPLTPSDVELYLKVMRAAAERVRHPSSDDMQTLAQARQIIATAANGRVPSSTDANTLQHASQICLAMDQIVAPELQVDPGNYTAISEAIEAVVPSPFAATPPDKLTVLPPRSPFERRIAEVDAANQTFLVPYRAEIQSLLAVVRNPANLPKT